MSLCPRSWPRLLWPRALTPLRGPERIVLRARVCRCVVSCRRFPRQRRRCSRKLADFGNHVFDRVPVVGKRNHGPCRRCPADTTIAFRPGQNGRQQPHLDGGRSARNDQSSPRTSDSFLRRPLEFVFAGNCTCVARSRRATPPGLDHRPYATRSPSQKLPISPAA